MLAGILIGRVWEGLYGHRIRKGEQRVENKFIENELPEFDHALNLGYSKPF